MTQDRFAGKVALVTGGAAGIGSATVRRLLAEGGQVALFDVSQQVIDAFTATLAEDERARVLGIAVDVIDTAAVDAGVAKVVERFGRLDVLVNNAGIGGVGKIHEVDEDAWRKVFDVDVDGVYRVTKAAIEHLRASKGNIVNLASISGIRGDIGMVAYDAAKGAIANFTRAMAVDYGHDGVRVNAVNPGPIRTRMLAEVLTHEDIHSEYQRRIPLGRVGEPEEVASVIAFLASADASYVSGVNLSVDGGLAHYSGQPDISAGLTH